MKFVPLEAKHVTTNGHGWRHELKIKEDDRVGMTEVYELFKAIYTYNKLQPYQH